MARKNSHKIEPYGFLRNLFLIESAYFDPRLQEQTKLTLALLVRYAAQDGNIEWFSIREAAERKGVSRRAIQNQIDKLERLNYIKRYKNKGKGWRNRYTLIFENLENYPPVTQSGHISPVTQSNHMDVTLSSDINVTSEGHTMKTSEKKEIKNKKNPLSRNQFLNVIKNKCQAGEYRALGITNSATLYAQGEAAWDYWEGHNKFPEGNIYCAFKGWLRTAIASKRLNQKNTDSSNMPKIDPQEAQWRARCKGYFDKNFWRTEWGPDPYSVDTKVPAHILKGYI